MKKIDFTPFMSVEADDGATTTTNTKSIYLGTIDNSRPVKATLTSSGTFGGGTLAVKFQDSADDTTYADVTGGGFTNMTAGGTETITFTLGSNVHKNTGIDNYGKFLRCQWSTTGGTAGDIDFNVALDNVFMPYDTLTFKLYQLPA